MAPLTRRLLVRVLEFQRRRPALEAVHKEKVNELAARLEAEVRNLWRITASLQALRIPGANADPDQPGYVGVPLSDDTGDVVYVPFHLVPATPNLPVLHEVVALASRVRLNRATGLHTAICLSGSTVILKDVLSVGDIDFCEYIPADAPPSELADAFRQQVADRDTRYCAVSIRLGVRREQPEELRSISAMFHASFDREQLEVMCRLIGKAQNVKTAHLVETRFAGVTEATNWVIIFRPPLEEDPGSRLSFAHQEASLGIFSRRPLHTLEALATYLNFLRREIEDLARSQPVKALKRAIPWLRLFSEDTLRAELMAAAARHQATRRAAHLSKLELLKKYSGKVDLRPELEGLLYSLVAQMKEVARELLVEPVDLEAFLRSKIEPFGEELTGTGSVLSGEPTLLQRMLSLAEAGDDY